MRKETREVSKVLGDALERVRERREEVVRRMTRVAKNMLKMRVAECPLRHYPCPYYYPPEGLCVVLFECDVTPFIGRGKTDAEEER